MLYRIDCPDTASNKPVYGVATITENAIYTRRLSGPPPAGARVIVREHAPRYPSYQEVTETGAGTQIAPITLSDIQALLPAARQYWLTAGASAALLDAAVVEVGALVPNLAGITIGNRITLDVDVDVDGAGWGWFVDATPAGNEEFALDAAVENLRATAGSAAAGKLDLLAVLIHELGHVLGAQDLPRAEDVMSGHLEAGVRRLPTVQDVALWRAAQQQRGQDSSYTAGFGMTISPTPAGSNSTPTASVPMPTQVQPNAQFAADMSTWSQQGGTVTTSGTAVLSESSASSPTQTHLGQTFINDAPVLPARSLSLGEDASIAINPLLGATDADGDVLLTASIVSGPLHGSLAFNACGSCSYTANADYFGAGSFTCTVSDGQSGLPQHLVRRICGEAGAVLEAGRYNQNLPQTSHEGICSGMDQVRCSAFPLPAF